MIVEPCDSISTLNRPFLDWRNQGIYKFSASYIWHFTLRKMLYGRDNFYFKTKRGFFNEKLLKVHLYTHPSIWSKIFIFTYPSFSLATSSRYKTTLNLCVISAFIATIVKAFQMQFTLKRTRHPFLNRRTCFISNCRTKSPLTSYVPSFFAKLISNRIGSSKRRNVSRDDGLSYVYTEKHCNVQKALRLSSNATVIRITASFVSRRSAKRPFVIQMPKFRRSNSHASRDDRLWKSINKSVDWIPSSWQFYARM